MIAFLELHQYSEHTRPPRVLVNVAHIVRIEPHWLNGSEIYLSGRPDDPIQVTETYDEIHERLANLRP